MITRRHIVLPVLTYAMSIVLCAVCAGLVCVAYTTYEAYPTSIAARIGTVVAIAGFVMMAFSFMTLQLKWEVTVRRNEGRLSRIIHTYLQREVIGYTTGGEQKISIDPSGAQAISLLLGIIGCLTAVWPNL